MLLIHYSGSNYGNHVCDCHYEAAGCIEEDTLQNTCNCDSKLPVELSDSGTITDFGGLTYDIQFGAFTLGRLKCYGMFCEFCVSLKIILFFYIVYI